MISIIVYTCIVLVKKQEFDTKELYEQYVIDYKEKNGEESVPELREFDIFMAEIIETVMVIGVLPASLMIYFSRLLTL